MAFTLTCHVCRHKLKLFDSSIKKRKGTVRCPHCSARISYDLDNRKIQQSGFWAAEEPAFDHRAKGRLLNQLDRDRKKQNPERLPTGKDEASFTANPFQARAGFSKFDLKTGQVLENGVKPSPFPQRAKETKLPRVQNNFRRETMIRKVSPKPIKKKSLMSFSWASSWIQKIKDFFHQ